MNERVRSIVARASSLRERLGGLFLAAAPDENDAARIDERLRGWRQVAAAGDMELFTRRLAWDGWDATSIRPALGAVRLRDGAPLPGWAETLAAVMETAMADPSLPQDPIANEPPLPFEQLYRPFVEVARQKLLARLDAEGARGQGALELLSKGARRSLFQALRSRLHTTGVGTLELEFNIFRGKEPAPGCYRAFVEGHLREGFDALFDEYSVLGRLLAVTVDLWVDATTELCLRLKSDWAAIQTTFQPLGAARDPEEPERVTAIDLSLSDPHRGGRSVAAISFRSGLRIIYKPKEMALEVAYGDLIAWLNARGAPLPLAAPRALERGPYGWVERIEHIPCEDEAAAARFYRRAGMLLCLQHTLEGTDCHSENLIACGEQPVLIDMEALLHHQASEILDRAVFSPAHAAALDTVERSVLRIGMLPSFKLAKKGAEGSDTSAIGDIGGGGLRVKKAVWSDLNTDLMAKTSTDVPRAPSANRVLLRGEVVSPHDHVEAIADGFRAMAGFLMNDEVREAMLAPDGPLAALGGKLVRFIFRSTSVYATIGRHALKPDRLRDGADRSIYLDVLSRAYTTAAERPPIWPLLEQELVAMEQLDIPFFTARADSDRIEVRPGVVVERYFKAPSVEVAAERVRSLDEVYLAQQIPVLFSVMNAARADAAEPKARHVLTETLSAPPRELFLDEAQRIARGLERTAIRAGGTATWVGLTSVPGTGSLTLNALTESLYDGASGVVLFLAALERMTSEADHRALRESVLRHLQRQIASSEFEHTATALGIGGASGLGSVVYALVTAGRLLDDATAVELAGRAALLITPDRIAKDESFDIIAGSAGAILGLLSLSRVNGDKEALARALLCGERLLQCRAASRSGPRTWRTLGGARLTGASHGAAGIAYALAKLSAATGEKAFEEAAREAIAYERSVFSAERNNWPDYRALASEGPRYQTAWCHGSPGIGLMRVGGLQTLDSEDIRQDIDAAIAATRAHGLSSKDDLCCGNLGLTELFVSAGRVLNRPELHLEAASQAAWIIERARRLGRFGLMGDAIQNDFNPGFFKGHAGVGYELLRLCDPAIVPSVLLFD